MLQLSIGELMGKGKKKKGLKVLTSFFLKAQFEKCMSRFSLHDTEYSNVIFHVFRWGSENPLERQPF